jgi:hypothetical protein
VSWLRPPVSSSRRGSKEFASFEFFGFSAGEWLAKNRWNDASPLRPDQAAIL